MTLIAIWGTGLGFLLGSIPFSLCMRRLLSSPSDLDKAS
jgi:glycerol-3-phosphate acyltransferase PlsY